MFFRHIDHLLYSFNCYYRSFNFSCPLLYTNTKMILQPQLIYGSLNNDILIRLVWQIFMFFLAPFLSIPDNLKELEQENSPLPYMIDLCRKQNWFELRIDIDRFQEKILSALYQFYETKNYAANSRNAGILQMEQL